MTARANEPGEEAVCRMDDNVLDTGTVPLIFVPGVMGSRIWIRGGRAWDPDSNGNMIGWAREDANDAYEALHSNNPASIKTDNDELTAAERERGWAGVAWGFYGDFVRDLQRRRFGSYVTPVYVVGYDWRQSNRASGRFLRRRVQAILDTEEVDRYILVSHSMGGLVTRSFLKDHAELRDKCLGIIHIAQPVHGGVVLVRRLFTGASMRYDGGYGVKSFVFTRILGTNRKDALTIAAGMPGPLQLLVTPNYRDRNAAEQSIGWYDYKTFERPDAPFQAWSGRTWDLYAQTQSPPGLLPPAGASYSPIAAARADFSTNLTLAKNFHDWLGCWKYEDKTWSIYSTGLRVDTRIPFELPPRQHRTQVYQGGMMAPPVIVHYGRRADGSEAVYSGDPNRADRGLVVTQTEHSDGTVPLMSAQGLFPGENHEVRRGTDYDTHHQFEVNDPEHDHAAHDSICQHPQTETATFDIIEHLLGI
ncbi:Lecithin:cholesterol acyltransferase [Enhygromyxa salina]|uniref:Lecithin:cholesterol acyltransferase n=1 Tax=Enhygromyxa salina TaxID=215803 RepID=A0A2S9YAX8_9BACT|nr:hypothetical protein [Enhygromyxa salina]PRQ02212.1 Lecithin:cholesterol acyltransferase [Enhygromyxa salina]